jgi:hypothetical protein
MNISRTDSPFKWPCFRGAGQPVLALGGSSEKQGRRIN